MKMTKYQLEHFRRKVDRQFNPLIENHGKPTTELLFEMRKAKEALNNWNSDSATFEKHQMVFPISAPVPQTELQTPEVEPINTD